MAFVFNNIQNNPQIHVFIIGVGGYPYLKGEGDIKRLLYLKKNADLS